MKNKRKLIQLFIVRLKFQKQSALKFVSQTIPHSGGYKTPWPVLGFIPVIFILTIFIAAPVYAKSPDVTNDKDVQEILEKGWQLLSVMHKDKTSLDKAIVLFKNALEKYPQCKELLSWKVAEMTFKKADEERDKEKREQLYKETLSYSQNAVHLNPQSIGGHYWVGLANIRLAELAGVFSAAGQVKRAKKELEKTISLNPDHRFAILSNAILAAIYMGLPWPMNDNKRAEKYAEEAVKKDPNLTLASVNLGKAYLNLKKYDKARDELNRCLSTKNPTYYWDSELYDWPGARKLLKEIENKK
jgi:tetratricopeptide (TPR) repeat protein